MGGLGARGINRGWPYHSFWHWHLAPLSAVQEKPLPTAGAANPLLQGVIVDDVAGVVTALAANPADGKGLACRDGSGGSVGVVQSS